ncbi:MAG: DUF1273 family protein [Clostridia bacterium]|nr:DUF1273 family protein [Clostridia bacterium]
MESQFKSCCFTGYRPSKFPFPLSKANGEYIEMENSLTTTLISLFEDGCDTFLSGGAMGFDIIAAEAVLELRAASKRPVKLICVLPFKEQASAYTDGWKARYDAVLSAADQIIYTSENYYKGCYGKRNKYMVDNSDYVLTWFDGTAGGTRNTVTYALKCNKRVVNLKYLENEQLSLFEDTVYFVDCSQGK